MFVAITYTLVILFFIANFINFVTITFHLDYNIKMINTKMINISDEYK